MADRPIIFQGEMVRATYSKLKSQTRRVIKPQPDFCRMSGSNEPEFVWWRKGPGTTATCPPIDKRAALEFCPYGVPGDTLWVRETWAKVYDVESPVEGDPFHIEYKANTGNPYPGEWPRELKDDEDCGRWKPSIHMPRYACRLELTVTKVRVERVQEISHDDAVAEGVTWVDHIDEGGHWESPSLVYPDGLQTDDPREAFMHLWDTINAKPKPVRKGGKIIHYVSYPWEDVQETREHRGLPWIVMGNPRVWPVDFKPKEIANA